MTWTRLGDDFADRPDVLPLTDAAFRTHVHALIYCNRQLTDGRLAAAAVRLVVAGDSDAVIAELLEAGLWEQVDGAYLVDWEEQESSDQVRSRKDRNAKANREYRERRELHGSGDHSKCDPRHCPFLRRDASRERSRDSSVTVTRPDPSRPPREGQGGGRQGRGSAAATPRPAATGSAFLRSTNLAACGHPLVDDRHCERGCSIGGDS